MSKFKGRILRERRKRLKLTQKQLAEKIEKSLMTLIRYENGSRIADSNTLMQLSKILKCNCKNFFE
jgi:transcriptional regulator with XRE-family HTH domain